MHHLCISKKHEHSVMTVFTALKLNVKFTHFVIVLKMIIHHSKKFQIYHVLFNMRAEQNFINQLLIKKKNFSNIQFVLIRILVIDEKHVTIYDRHILNLEATDCEKETRCKKHIFKATDIHNYDIILKYL